MDLDVLFVGTAGSIPSARRALPATLVRRGGDRLLFDCGEGTQRQLLRSVGLLELEEVFLTHFHADHVLGLPGMLKTYGLRGRELPLTVYGPEGLAGLFRALRPVIGRLGFDVELIELEPNAELRREGYRIGAFAVDHGVPALGYAGCSRSPTSPRATAGASCARRHGRRSRRRSSRGTSTASRFPFPSAASPSTSGRRRPGAPAEHRRDPGLAVRVPC
jgi:ribonuclease BN (tRNA processing enzyme)